MRVALLNVIWLLLASLSPLPVAAALLEGNVFQPQGENLVIQTPPGWRLAYMNGDPNGDYVAEFMPNNESHDSWREGMMSVQRGAYEMASGAHPSTQIVQRVLHDLQRNCAGRFTPMKQKDSMSNGAYASISGGFCDRYADSSAAPYGEGKLVAVLEGKKNLFLMQFGWRPATEDSWKNIAWRITPQQLQQYLNLLNQANLCGGEGQLSCPP